MAGKRRAPIGLKRFERPPNKEGLFRVTPTEDDSGRKESNIESQPSTESVPPLARELRPRTGNVTWEQLLHFWSAVRWVFGVMLAIAAAIFWFGRLDAQVDNIKSDVAVIKVKIDGLSGDVERHTVKIETLERQNNLNQPPPPTEPSGGMKPIEH